MHENKLQRMRDGVLERGSGIMDCYNNDCPIRANTSSNVYACYNSCCQRRQPYPVAYTTTNHTVCGEKKEG